jgi:hypothetical protein
MDENGKKQCWICNNVLAIFGAVVSVALLLVAVDLMSNGKVSSFIRPPKSVTEDVNDD